MIRNQSRDAVISDFESMLLEVIDAHHDDAHDLASWLAALDRTRAAVERELHARMMRETIDASSFSAERFAELRQRVAIVERKSAAPVRVNVRVEREPEPYTCRCGAPNIEIGPLMTCSKGRACPFDECDWDEMPADVRERIENASK